MDCSMCSSSLLGPFGITWYPNERMPKVGTAQFSCLVPFVTLLTVETQNNVCQTKLNHSGEVGL